MPSAKTVFVAVRFNEQPEHNIHLTGMSDVMRECANPIGVTKSWAVRQTPVEVVKQKFRAKPFSGRGELDHGELRNVIVGRSGQQECGLQPGCLQGLKPGFDYEIFDTTKVVP